MAILLHYFLLATFSWMFVDGIELIIALKNLFKIDRIRILAYALYSYGFPLLIVILSISLSNHSYYQNKQYVLKKLPIENFFDLIVLNNYAVIRVIRALSLDKK